LYRVEVLSRCKPLSKTSSSNTALQYLDLANPNQSSFTIMVATNHTFRNIPAARETRVSIVRYFGTRVSWYYSGFSMLSVSLVYSTLAGPAGQLRSIYDYSPCCPEPRLFLGLGTTSFTIYLWRKIK
jgi:hypothetical protein